MSENLKKHILITTAGLSSVGQGGGISSYAHDLATNLSFKGYEVIVLLVKENQNKEPKGVNYKYYHFEIPKNRVKEKEVVKSLLDSINTLMPDIIINNDVSYIAGLWPVLNKNIIRISVMHGFSNKCTWTNAGIMGKIATLNHKYLDYIVCQNNSMVIDAAKKYKVNVNKLVFIPQTVSIPSTIKTQKTAIFTIVFAGGMNRRKGSLEMLKIARLLKNTKLDFKVNWCMFAEEYANEFKSDSRFEFKGQLPREIFLQTIADSDCIIIPTHMDTGPLLLVEAMALGVIPICNNLTKSAIPDIIENGINGFVIDDNDPNKYVKTIIHLMNLENNVIGKTAYNYFQNNLTMENQITRFEALFYQNREPLQALVFSDDFVVHNHLHNTSHFPIYSYKRIVPKILNALEIVLTEKKYTKIFKKII